MRVPFPNHLSVKNHKLSINWTKYYVGGGWGGGGGVKHSIPLYLIILFGCNPLSYQVQLYCYDSFCPRAQSCFDFLLQIVTNVP